MDLIHVPAAQLPVRQFAPSRRPSRPLVFALPYAAWLCCLGVPGALFAR